MLRRQSSPTQTELRLEHSQIINEALEMTEVDFHLTETLDPCASIDAHTQA